LVSANENNAAYTMPNPGRKLAQGAHEKNLVALLGGAIRILFHF